MFLPICPMVWPNCSPKVSTSPRPTTFSYNVSSRPDAPDRMPASFTGVRVVPRVPSSGPEVRGGVTGVTTSGGVTRVSFRAEEPDVVPASEIGGNTFIMPPEISSGVPVVMPGPVVAVPRVPSSGPAVGAGGSAGSSRRVFLSKRRPLVTFVKEPSGFSTAAPVSIRYWATLKLLNGSRTGATGAAGTAGTAGTAEAAVFFLSFDFLSSLSRRS